MTEKATRTTLTLYDKVQILDRLESGEKQSLISKEYGIGQSTVSTILKRKQDIRYKHAMSRSKTAKQFKQSKVDELLLVWINLKQSLGHKIADKEIKAKALELEKTHRTSTSNSFKVKTKIAGVLYIHVLN